MRTRPLTPVVAALGLLLLSGCATGSPTTVAEPSAVETPAAQTPSGGATADAGGDCQYLPSTQGAARAVDAPPATPPAVLASTATMQTSVGAIAVTLDAAATPCTVSSFVSLAQQGYYDDTICHRLITEGIYILQCGDPSGTGRGGPGYSYADELTGAETYPAGTVAMANAGPDTNGSQFFLVFDETPLPPEYTVFGKMDAAGLAVVQSAAAGGADASDVPLTPVTITGVALS